MVYTHWLNARGCIESDLTVIRVAEDEFIVISGAAVTHKDLNWLSQNIDANSHCFHTDVTSAYAMIGVMGPESRNLLERVTGESFSTDVAPFGSSRITEIGYAPVRASRVSFVGELGWEVLVPVDMAVHVFDRLVEAGESLNLSMAGMHALDSCRLEKKFLHYGHDIGDEDTPLEAGAGFVCAMDKTLRFIGYDAIARQKDSGSHLQKRLVQFLLSDPEQCLYHHEPILMNGDYVGYLTSGNYGHTLGGSVGLGYVKLKDNIDAALLDSESWEIEVAGERIAATASLRAMYDPAGARMRG